MKTIARHQDKKVYQTSYSPLFGYKVLVKLLEDLEINCYSHGKSRNTNSYYIEAENEENGNCGEIRISNHSKFISVGESTENFNFNFYDDGSISFDINIISKEGFQKAKELLISNFKNVA